MTDRDRLRELALNMEWAGGDDQLLSPTEVLALLDAEAGLRETLERVLPTLSHWPRDAPGHGWNTATEPHSKMCPPCVLRAALGAAQEKGDAG